MFPTKDEIDCFHSFSWSSQRASLGSCTTVIPISLPTSLFSKRISGPSFCSHPCQRAIGAKLLRAASSEAPRKSIRLLHLARRGPPAKASECLWSEDFCVPHPRGNIGSKRVSTLRDSDVRIEWLFGHKQGSLAKSRVATNVTTTGSQKVSILKSFKP